MRKVLAPTPALRSPVLAGTWSYSRGTGQSLKPSQREVVPATGFSPPRASIGKGKKLLPGCGDEGSCSLFQPLQHTAGRGSLTTQVSFPSFRSPAHSIKSDTVSKWALTHFSLGKRSRYTHWRSSGNLTVDQGARVWSADPSPVLGSSFRPRCPSSGCVVWPRLTLAGFNAAPA